MDQKKFELKFSFSDILDMKDCESEDSDFYNHNITWKCFLGKYDDNYDLDMVLDGWENPKWKVKFDVNLKLGESEESIKMLESCEYDEETEILSLEVIPINSMMNFVDREGRLDVKISITILEIQGIRANLRVFDETEKENSDVVLVVQNEKFFVSKFLLSLHSTYFKSMFNSGFKESQQSSIELKDIDPFAFRNYLHMIYGEPYIFDGQVLGVVKLADMFDSQAVKARCEHHLINHSKLLTEEDKFDAAVKYGMKDLKARNSIGFDIKLLIIQKKVISVHDVLTFYMRMKDLLDYKNRVALLDKMVKIGGYK